LNSENFTYLLANPQKLTSEDLDALADVIKKYPYFQSARALQLKSLKNQESFLYNDALKLAAAHTTDRDILFEYITSERFIQNEISQTILQHDTSINEIKVISEDISAQMDDENALQLKVEMQKAEDILNPELFQRKVQSITNLVKRENAIPEEKHEEPPTILETDKPLEFEKSDTHSFSEWLKLTKATPIERIQDKKELESENPSEKVNIKADSNEQDEAEEQKEWKTRLIDRFIQEKPKITPSETTGNTAKKGVDVNDVSAFPQSSESLMTETLAKVYLQQKNYKKAIQAYKILILKNPEKSGSFADQIRAIEKLINS